METSQIMTLVAAIVTAPLSAWLTSILMRRKYNVEVEQLKSQVNASKADTRGDELENVKKGNDILMEQVVTPLKKEINDIRKELRLLRKAVEKANTCPHADACPVRNELQDTGKDSVPAD